MYTHSASFLCCISITYGCFDKFHYLWPSFQKSSRNRKRSMTWTRKTSLLCFIGVLTPMIYLCKNGWFVRCRYKEYISKSLGQILRYGRNPCQCVSSPFTNSRIATKTQTSNPKMMPACKREYSYSWMTWPGLLWLLWSVFTISQRGLSHTPCLSHSAAGPFSFVLLVGHLLERWSLIGFHPPPPPF